MFQSLIKHRSITGIAEEHDGSPLKVLFQRVVLEPLVGGDLLPNHSLAVLGSLLVSDLGFHDRAARVAANAVSSLICLEFR